MSEFGRVLPYAERRELHDATPADLPRLCNWCDEEAVARMIDNPLGAPAGWTDYACPVHLKKYAPYYDKVAAVQA